MEFTEVMEEVARGFEILGVAIIVIGGTFGMLHAWFARARWERTFWEEARVEFGHPLLLGLEVLVAADIIATVTTDRSLESVASLGLLVLIRVVLSFSLDIEIDGMFPWRRTLPGSRPTVENGARD